MANVSDVTDESFQIDVMNADMPLLLDFWAPWCGPCKMVLGALDEIAEHFAGRVKVCKLNIDENSAVPINFGIRTVPTLALFLHGKVVATKTGPMTKGQLTNFVESNIQ